MKYLQISLAKNIFSLDSQLPAKTKKTKKVQLFFFFRRTWIGRTEQIQTFIFFSVRSSSPFCSFIFTRQCGDGWIKRPASFGQHSLKVGREEGWLNLLTLFCWTAADKSPTPNLYYRGGSTTEQYDIKAPSKNKKVFVSKSFQAFRKLRQTQLSKLSSRAAAPPPQ